MSEALADENVRSLAEEVLKRTEYARWRIDEDQLDRILEFLSWIRNFFSWMDLQYINAPWIFWSVIWGLAFVSALLLAHVIWSIRIALRPSTTRKVHSLLSEAPNLIEEARILAANGQYLEAAHRIELATIALLLKREVLELARSDTNQTLRRRLATTVLPDSAREEFLTLLNRLERQRFRDHVDDPTLYEAWCTLHQHLETVAGRA